MKHFSIGLASGAAIASAFLVGFSLWTQQPELQIAKVAPGSNCTVIYKTPAKTQDKLQ